MYNVTGIVQPSDLVTFLNVATLHITKFNVQFLFHCSVIMLYYLLEEVHSSCYTAQYGYSPHYNNQCSVTSFNVDTSRITTLNVRFLSHCSVCIHFTLQCPVLVAMFNVDQCSPQWNVQCSDCVTLFSINAVRIHCSLFSSCFSMLIYYCSIVQ